MPIRVVRRATDLPYLVPTTRVALLVHEILGTRWDDATWPKAKTALKRALKIQSKLRADGWWN